jgi:hypothetical protein
MICINSISVIQNHTMLSRFLWSARRKSILPWIAEHKKIDLWGAICDKFKNHYIVDCNTLNIMGMIAIARQPMRSKYTLWVSWCLFFYNLSKECANVSPSVQTSKQHTNKNYLKISQPVCISSDRRCYTMISEHLHDIYIQLPDPGCRNSPSKEISTR